MLKAGVDVKIVSTLLGDSNSSVTREIYQHVLDTDQLRYALKAAAAEIRGPALRLVNLETERP
jgi:site-specific recombinase XerD